MIKISIGKEPLGSLQAKAIVAFVNNIESNNSTLRLIAEHYQPALYELVSASSFSGKAGSSFVLPVVMQNKEVCTLIIMGLASSSTTIDAMELYRRAVGKAIKIMQDKKITTGILLIPSAEVVNQKVEYMVQETALIASMAEFHFDEFITNPDRKVVKNIVLEFVVSESSNALQEAIDRGLIIAQGVNQARFWVDMPPSRLTPVDLVEKAKTISQKHGLAFTSFSEREIIAMGMGGLAGVSAGSEQDCALVILEYKTSKPNAQTLALVGKGITFDSGGLSLKPADYMESMKDDMAGAAAVINTMQVLAQLKPDINVIGITPLSENLPSGKATKPGDILRFYNGKTAEVRNTDAEGRLILADALSYAVQHYKLDAIIDIATLTGACAHALGPFFTGLMTQYPDLAHKIEKAGSLTGDRVWPLPFVDDYKAAIKSHVADICNIGSRKYRAGAITAGFFLKEFVGETPWAHLDIAGTAFEVPDISYLSHGATGTGVRLFVELALSWNSL